MTKILILLSFYAKRLKSGMPFGIINNGTVFSQYGWMFISMERKA